LAQGAPSRGATADARRPPPARAPRPAMAVVTLDGLKDELRNFAEGALRRELLEVTARVKEACVKEDSLGDVRGKLQQILSILESPTRPTQGGLPGCEELSHHPHEWMTRHIRPHRAMEVHHDRGNNPAGALFRSTARKVRVMARMQTSSQRTSDVGLDGDNSEEPQVELSSPSAGVSFKAIVERSRTSPSKSNTSGLAVAWQPSSSSVLPVSEHLSQSISRNSGKGASHHSTHDDWRSTFKECIRDDCKNRRSMAQAEYDLTVSRASGQSQAQAGWICRTRARLSGIVLSPWFHYAAGILVILNALTIGVQTDFVARHQKSVVPVPFRVTEACFAVLFGTELACRIFVYGCRFFQMPGWEWNMMDCLVVGLQVIEAMLLGLVYGYASSNSVPVNFSFVRVLRIFRLARVVRIVRILKVIGELRTLVTSIGRSFKSLAWTIVLLLMMMYVVGVYFTQVVTDHLNDRSIATNLDTEPAMGTDVSAEPDDGPQYTERLRHFYGDLGRSLLSLYESITGGISWGELVVPLMDDISPLLAIAFSLYIAFAVIAVLNIVTGVFVESAIKSAKDDNDYFMINNVREVFRDSNGDIASQMCWEDFESQLHKPHMQEYFQAIDVDLSEAKGLFRLLDLDDSGSIDAEEFLSGCLRLRGPAKALDLALLIHEVKRLYCGLQMLSRRVDPHFLMPSMPFHGAGDAALGG